MIIANIDKNGLRTVYLKLLRQELKRLVIIYKNKLDNILSLYNDSLVDEAINHIYLVGNSIFCPTSGLYGKLLRSLEYGTNNTKAYHLITIAVKHVFKEVDINEYVI